MARIAPRLARFATAADFGADYADVIDADNFADDINNQSARENWIEEQESAFHEEIDTKADMVAWKDREYNY